MLPRVVLDNTWRIGHPDVLMDRSGLDRSSLCRLSKIEQAWGVHLVGIAMWGGGVPYTYGHTDGVDMWSWGLPGQSCPRFKACRFLVTCIPTQKATRKTHDKILEIMRWSFQAMAIGKHPSVDHQGQPLPSHLAKISGQNLPFHGDERRLEILQQHSWFATSEAEGWYLLALQGQGG